MSLFGVSKCKYHLALAVFCLKNSQLVFHQLLCCSQYLNKETRAQEKKTGKQN